MGSHRSGYPLTSPIKSASVILSATKFHVRSCALGERMNMTILCIPGHKGTCAVHKATCSLGTAYGYGYKEKQRFIPYVPRHKATSEHRTRSHGTSEHPMDTRHKSALIVEHYYSFIRSGSLPFAVSVTMMS